MICLEINMFYHLTLFKCTAVAILLHSEYIFKAMWLWRCVCARLVHEYVCVGVGVCMSTGKCWSPVAMMGLESKPLSITRATAIEPPHSSIPYSPFHPSLSHSPFCPSVHLAHPPPSCPVISAPSFHHIERHCNMHQQLCFFHLPHPSFPTSNS